MRALPLLVLTVLAGLVLGCEEESSGAVDCEGATLTIEVVEPSADAKVSGDLIVRGTVVQSEDYAVHRVRVAGRDVTRTGFNFRTWETTIPLSALKALDPASPVLTAEAEDTCGNVASTQVAVAVQVPVTGLTVVATYPNGKFAPATKPIPVTIAVNAAASSAGGTVSVIEPPGWDFLGLTSAKVTLAGDGVAPASATFSATCGADAVDVLAPLTVTAGDANQTTFLKCAGAPLLESPSFDVAIAVAPVTVEVRSKGDVAGCQASAPVGVTVLSGMVDLEGATTVQDTNGNGAPDFRVGADMTAVAGTVASVSCWDSYLQTTTATFTVVP